MGMSKAQRKGAKPTGPYPCAAGAKVTHETTRLVLGQIMGKSSEANFVASLLRPQL